MRTRYVMKCSNCGGPAADSVRLCPYCGHATGFEDLGLGQGMGRSADGGLVILEGAQLVVGFEKGAQRECPFCGAKVDAEKKHCPHCREKIVIEQMRVATLEVDGGGLIVHRNAAFEVVGRRKLPIHEAARKNDPERLKACIVDGDDPNHPDNRGARPLHYAAQGGAVDSTRYLISVGADVNAADDRKQRPLHAAAKKGHEAVIDVLLMVAAETNIRDEKMLTPSELAARHGHAVLAERLAQG